MVRSIRSTTPGMPTCMYACTIHPIIYWEEYTESTQTHTHTQTYVVYIHTVIHIHLYTQTEREREKHTQTVNESVQHEALG